jgi:hypothetical protein
MEKLKRSRPGIYTEYIPFMCTPQIKLLLEAMAAQAGVSRSTMIKLLILEGADQRKITLEPKEVKNEKES